MKISLLVLMLPFLSLSSYANSVLKYNSGIKNNTGNLSISYDDLQSTISGSVIDANGIPLPGATILEKGTTNGTATDFDGGFTLDLTSADAVIIISSLGYKTQEIVVGNQTTIDITMQEDAAALDEVVVVGYGAKKRSLLTGAISSVDTKAIQNASNQRVEQVLQGRTSGVTVTSSSGSPGAGAQIRIRGTGSSGGSEPLYIVDGMKTFSIVDLAPSDIANMEILKDAASSAIYGTEGANGVVIITTKRGRTDGGFKVGFSTQLGTQFANTDMELMNAAQFVQYMNEAGQTGVTDNGVDTNWLEEIFSSAPTKRFDINVSGGKEKLSFYFSASTLNQDGIVARNNSNFKRTTMRLNLKSELADWIELGGNMNLSTTDRIGIQEDNDTRGVIQNALIIDPLTPVFYNDGEVPQSVIDRSNDNNVPVITNGAGRVFGYPAFSTGEVLNPVAFGEALNRNTFDGSQFLSTIYAKFKPFEGFDFTTRFGYEDGSADTRNTQLPYFVASEAANTSFIGSQDFNKRRRWLWENFATYTKSFGNHNFKVLLGYSAEDTEVETIVNRSGSVAVDEFTSFDFELPGFNNQINIIDPFFDNLVSFYGRLSYNFNDKYLFEGSFRNDTSDKFRGKNKNAFFPAVSGGWIISNEDFWNEDSPVSYLKLRASWGQNGNKQNIPGNADIIGITTISNGLGINYLGNQGAQINGFANPDLVWETSEQTDIGVDLRAFNNRLRFSADYYIKTTRDLLVADGGLITPGSAGFQSREFNAGTIENKGFEFELGYGDTTEGGFKYNINLNLSTLKNEVTEIKFVPEGTSLVGASAPQNPDGVTRFGEGFPAWYFFGFKTNGIDPATGEVIRVDTDGVPGINNNDKTFIGSPHPDLLFGGNIALAYKAFDFNLQFQGTAGNDIMATYHQPSRPITNKPVHFFNERWQQPGDIASYPGAANVIGAYDTDLVVEDGSYVRIKQIQLGYTLPQRYIENSKLTNLRVYVSLDDFFTFTKFRGLDPEIGNTNFNSIGVDRGFYPIAARAIFGLSLNLF